MKYSIEEIKEWSLRGEVTKAEVVLDLIAELERLKCQTDHD